MSGRLQINVVNPTMGELEDWISLCRVLGFTDGTRVAVTKSEFKVTLAVAMDMDALDLSGLPEVD